MLSLLVYLNMTASECSATREVIRQSTLNPTCFRSPTYQTLHYLHDYLDTLSHFHLKHRKRPIYQLRSTEYQAGRYQWRLTR